MDTQTAINRGDRAVQTISSEIFKYDDPRRSFEISQSSQNYPLESVRQIEPIYVPSKSSSVSREDRVGDDDKFQDLVSQIELYQKEIQHLKDTLDENRKSFCNATTSSTSLQPHDNSLDVFSFTWEGSVPTASLQKKLSQIAMSLEEVGLCFTISPPHLIRVF